MTNSEKYAIILDVEKSTSRKTTFIINNLSLGWMEEKFHEKWKIAWKASCALGEVAFILTNLIYVIKY